MEAATTTPPGLDDVTREKLLELAKLYRDQLGRVHHVDVDALRRENQVLREQFALIIGALSGAALVAVLAWWWFFIVNGE